MPATADGWTRIRRRPAGTDPDGPASDKVPGPWHALREAYGSRDQTWCGRRFRVLAQEHAAEPPAGDPTCPTCLRALEEDRPRSWRRR